MPSDLSLRDDDQISSALGYVVHLMLLASKYLEVSWYLAIDIDVDIDIDVVKSISMCYVVC